MPDQIDQNKGNFLLWTAKCLAALFVVAVGISSVHGCILEMKELQNHIFIQPFAKFMLVTINHWIPFLGAVFTGLGIWLEKKSIVVTGFVIGVLICFLSFVCAYMTFTEVQEYYREHWYQEIALIVKSVVTVASLVLFIRLEPWMKCRFLILLPGLLFIAFPFFDPEFLKLTDAFTIVRSTAAPVLFPLTLLFLGGGMLLQQKEKERDKDE